MGWTFPWYSSAGSDFNHDLHASVDERVQPVLLNYRDVDELADHGFAWTPARRGDYPGLSAFLRVGDDIFHTYSTRADVRAYATRARAQLVALPLVPAWSALESLCDFVIQRTA
jgi:predicted dithiol-disulfide oxidoreductase (DUF899 family)